jgi:transcriptional regulator with XRE-family HTH domain
MDSVNKYKALRQQRSLSVAEASKLLGISESHLWSIENGNRQPGKKVIVRMARLYKAKIETLFFAS